MAAQRPIMFASPAHPGQLNPLLVIAAELSRRGVPDLWFSAEESARPHVAGHVSGSPLRFLSTGETRLRVADELYASMTRGLRTTDGMVELARTVRRPSVTQPVFDATVDQLEQVRPRLMVIDALNLGALDAAVSTGTPFVLSVPFPVSGAYLSRLPWSYPTPTSGLPQHMTARQRMVNTAYRLRLQFALVRALAGKTAQARRRAGISNVYGDPERYSATARAVLGYSVFGLEYPFPAPDHLHMLGAVIPEPSDADSGAADELIVWLDRHPSVVYVCLGTLAQLDAQRLLALLEALTRLGPHHQVLWKLPAAQRALLPAVLPAHLRIVDWVPSQLDVLAHPHVRAFVNHGGANGFHEGVYFGQPTLVMPFWLDCYDIAARAVDAGVGLAIDRPPHIDANEVHAKVLRLLTEDRFRERSRDWGRRMREAGGAARAADLILRLAADPAPPTTAARLGRRAAEPETVR